MSLKDSDADKSHAFNGPGNTDTQGDAIPPIYGRVLTGSVPVSFDSDIEDTGASSGGTGSLACMNNEPHAHALGDAEYSFSFKRQA